MDDPDWLDDALDRAPAAFALGAAFSLLPPLAGHPASLAAVATMTAAAVALVLGDWRAGGLAGPAAATCLLLTLLLLGLLLSEIAVGQFRPGVAGPWAIADAGGAALALARLTHVTAAVAWRSARPRTDADRD